MLFSIDGILQPKLNATAVTQMFKKTRAKGTVVVLLLAVACSVAGVSAGGDRVYKLGVGDTIKLAGDLHDALPQKFFDQLDTQAITMHDQAWPLIAPVAVTADNRIQRQVELSAGFVDLVNRLCHAKAIDKVEVGYFDAYVTMVGQVCASNPAAPPPPITEPRYWTRQILNDQLSYFNEMMGMMMAVNMAHHYLGYYTKYASKLTGPGDKVVPINDFLTPSEWDASIKAGALDALNCALSTEGLRLIFDALDKMPIRPPWAAYIAPPYANFKQLDRELANYEEDFFHGRIKN